MAEVVFAVSSGAQLQAMEEVVLNKYYPDLVKTLIYRQVFPYVVQKGLVTHSQIVELASAPEAEKPEKLLAMLPGNGSGFLSKFIWCLRQSDNGTAHGYLAQSLEKAQSAIRATWKKNKPTTRADTGVMLYRKEGYGLINGTEVQGDNYNNKRRIQDSWARIRGLCEKKLLCCYLWLVVVLVIGIAGMVLLALVPSLDYQVHPHQLFSDDTVELHFDKDIWWIHEMTMSVSGYNSKGKVLVIEGTSCSDFSESHASKSLKVVNGYYEPQNYVYMLKGSFVVFNISSQAHGDVWLFTSLEEAKKYEYDKESFDCNDHPSTCFQSDSLRGQQYKLRIDKTSYYFIRFSENSIVHEWAYHIRYYDYSSLSSEYTPRLTLTSQPRTLKLGSFFHFHTSCILVHMQSGSGELRVTDIRQRQDLLVFPGILLLVILLALVIVIGVHCKYWRRRRVYNLL